MHKPPAGGALTLLQRVKIAAFLVGRCFVKTLDVMLLGVGCGMQLVRETKCNAATESSEDEKMFVFGCG